MADSTRVNVRGVRELSSSLKRVSKETQDGLKVGFRAIAERVVGVVQAKVPYRSGRAAGSVKARGSTRGASIAFGGSKAPYYPWLDFGGNAGPNKRNHRDFIKEGRYVYPTIREERPRIERDVEDLIERSARQAGFTVK